MSDTRKNDRSDERSPSGDDDTTPGIPEAWLAAIEGRVAVAEVLDEDHPMREVFTPLARDARARIVGRAVARHLEDRAAPTRPPVKRSIIGRVLLGVSLPWAAVLTFMSMRADPAPPPDTVEASSSARDVVRSTASGPLNVPSGGHFWLDCDVPGHVIQIHGVVATRPPDFDAMPPRLLGAPLPPEPRPSGATLQVHADLEPGPWQITCGVSDLESGRFWRLSQYASIEVVRNQ